MNKRFSIVVTTTLLIAGAMGGLALAVKMHVFLILIPCFMFAGSMVAVLVLAIIAAISAKDIMKEKEVVSSSASDSSLRSEALAPSASLPAQQPTDTGEDERTGRAQTNPDIQELLIDESQFAKLSRSVTLWHDFYFELARNSSFYDYVVNTLLQGNDSVLKNITSIAFLLKNIGMKDVFTCLDSIDYSVSSITYLTYLGDGKHQRHFYLQRKESQVLFAFMLVDMDREATYAQFESLAMQSLNGNSSQQLMMLGNHLNDYVNYKADVTCEEAKDYQIALLLKSYSMDKECLQYKKILYDIMFCFCQANGMMTDNAKALLKKLGREAHVVEPGITVNTRSGNPLDELDCLVGLTDVKQSIISLTNFIRVNQKRERMGLKVPSVSYHCVFSGNPGTGKTTVARILANIYKDLGILETGQLIETDRSGLVAEYMGQTAIKTNEIIDKAIGGVLFIDEAYSLAAGGKEDYGREAIATLLKRMEDDRDKLVVILAGYDKEMEDFINANPGLRSRFSRYMHFRDYTASELHQIFLLNMCKFDYHLTPNADQFLTQQLEQKVANKPKDFGNAREVRNLFEKVVEAQSDRIQQDNVTDKESLSSFTLSDIRKACCEGSI